MSETTEVPLSPRAVILAGLNPAGLAVGYSDADQRWVSAADLRSEFDPLPRLDGVLVIGEPALAAAADDFGHIVHRRPRPSFVPGHGTTLRPSCNLRVAMAFRSDPAVRATTTSVNHRSREAC